MTLQDAKPPVPMSADAYADWRLSLWQNRGPNHKWTNEEGLLPCYQHALDKCGQATAKGRAMDGAAGMQPAAMDVSEPAPTATTNAAVAPPAGKPQPATRQRIVEALARGVASGQQEPFYLVDLDAALDRLALWRSELPDIEPHYAVKCNGDPALLLSLAHAGVGFDCASQAELEAVLALGVPASRLLYANPIKQPSHVRFARERGVPMTVFDGAEELRKMAAHYPACELLLRIAVDDSSAQCVLSNKYGAQPDDAEGLLDLAYSLNLNVAGVSFHVGSGSSEEDPFADAVGRAAAVFAHAAARGRPMRVLDVGGGFPGADTPSINFRSMAKALRDALATHFPKPAFPHLELVAEPGRFFAAPTHILAASIIGKKVFPPPSPAQAPAQAPAKARTMYYINDGLYGSFNCVLYDHATPLCEVLPLDGDAAAPPPPAEAPGGGGGGDAPHACSIWGPTCDGIDCVAADTDLPSALPVGAWLWFAEMGAYTRCAGSNFNGMALPDVLYLQSRSGESRPQPPNVAAAHMLQQLRKDGIGC